MALLFIVTLFSLLFAKLSLCASASGSNATDASLVAAASSSLVFTSSKWIWTASSTAGSTVSLRKDFTPPLGKSLIAAEIIITADSQLTFYVNGELVGSGTPPNRPRFAQRFCVDLLPSFNVFAATGIAPSTPSDGGLLATILLTYSDLTTDTILSDSSWRVHAGAPVGFQQLSFDDTAWPAATVVGSFGDAPWDEVNIPANPPVLTFDRAEWVWTDVVPASGTLPAGSRAFRRTFTPAPGQVPMSAQIIMAADNLYTLYVNGVQIDANRGFTVANNYIINFSPSTTEIVLAVLVTNNAASPAGLLLAMEVNMVPSGRANCTAGSFLLTDNGWLSTKAAIPAGWEQPGFDDSAWPPVVSEGAYPVAPWGTNTIAPPSAPVNV
ncbi:hypothetical protein MSAN_02127600 [Mycena sanguinolenta]|uniref:Uncharacterized protein n=1 Tax=Mycena sanguinolenta TaxID=230812 RepID=A0A8H6XHG3_9AGAR|nr:hypothetical protein MSAN_02127600 [Mycena sanguinolenta]